MRNKKIKPFRNLEQAEKSYFSLMKRYGRKIELAKNFKDKKSVQSNQKKVHTLEQKYILRVSATERLESN